MRNNKYDCCVWNGVFLYNNISRHQFCKLYTCRENINENITATIKSVSSFSCTCHNDSRLLPADFDPASSCVSLKALWVSIQAHSPPPLVCRLVAVDAVSSLVVACLEELISDRL